MTNDTVMKYSKRTILILFGTYSLNVVYITLLDSSALSPVAGFTGYTRVQQFLLLLTAAFFMMIFIVNESSEWNLE